ncbi:6-phosphogluconolactonase [Rudanella lutea]|uniref:6-phosphogluconolactonase n=1 Tax=Rudanella lutea TaxID=451374 RepID=UPI00035DA154|nr:6-phosphogluconolactonase [Rudanella lutea]
MEIGISPDAGQLARDVADWLVRYEHEVLRHADRFCIALSGGSTPKALHQLLAQAPYRDALTWSKWHVFWGDERYVSLQDDRNNARMAYDTLLNHVPIPAEQIHVMQTDLEPAQSMMAYEQLLHGYFDNRPHTFDLVLLGMGDDGHTLSLFPGTEVVHDQTNWTRAYFLEAQDMYRLTLTAPIVNEAAAVAFLVAGEKKAEPLREVLYGEFNPDKYPSQVIKPAGKLYWFLDTAAAASINQP